MTSSPCSVLAAAYLGVALALAVAANGNAQPLELPSLAVPAAGPVDDQTVIALPVAGDGQDDQIAVTVDAPDDSIIRLPGQAPAPGATESVLDSATRLSSLWPRKAGYVADARFRLTGEKDEAEFLLFVDDVRGVNDIVVSTQSSAYVFPQQSTIKVMLGDTELASFAPDNISGAGHFSFPAPPGALRQGLNLVRIEAEHAHRIFCGAQAAYDLWTEIELSQSGAVVRAGSIGAGPAGFLSAVGIARGEGHSIRVVSGGSDRAHTLSVLRELGSIMNGEGLSFSSDAAAPQADGALLPVISIGPGERSRATFSRTEEGANVLRVIVGPTGLPDLQAEFGLAGAEEPLPEIARNRKVSLRELGYTDHEVSHNLWLGRFGFSLPADWLITTGARAEIGLRLGTAYTMPAGAQVRVLVNGTSVQMLPLSERLYKSGTARQIRFPAHLFQGGRNEFAVELVVPGDPADRPCPAVSSPKIFLDAGTTLFIPESAPLVAPILGRALEQLTIAALAPDGPDRTGKITPDDIARLAATLPLSAEAAPDPGISLQVIALDEVPQATFGSLWSGREILLDTLQLETRTVADSPPALHSQSTQLSADPVRMSFLPDVNPLRWLVESIGAAARGARKLLHPDPASELAGWMATHRAQAMLYQLDKETPDQLYLVLADAADTQIVFAALGRVMSYGVPLSGQVALLDWEGGWSSWTDRTRLPMLTGGVTWTNLRAVIGNYASARPLYFVLALMVLTLVSAMIARSIILNSRPEQ